MNSLRHRIFDISFAALLLVGAAVLLYIGRGLTFFYDEWQLLLVANPLAPSSLLDGHNGQPLLIPNAIYGTLLYCFGMTSQLPFRLVAIAAASVCVVLLYVYIRRRTSPAFALVLILPILVFGTAWEALLLPLSMNFLIGLAAGLAMLLALEARSRKGDVVACFLLLFSIANGGVGLAFAAGAAVDVLLRRDPRRIWIPAIPVLLILLWYQVEGVAPGYDYGKNALALPDYLYSAGRAVLAGLSGLGPGRLPLLPVGTLSGLALLILLAAIVARVTLVKAPLSRQALVVGSVLIAFWVLGGLAMSEGRAPEASRYQYPAAVLLLALSACLLDGLRLPRWLPLVLLPFVLVSAALNLRGLEDGRRFLREQTVITRASTGGLEVYGQGLEGLNLTKEVTGSPYQALIVSGPYFRATSRFGSPAYSSSEIKGSGEVGLRAAAGVEIAAALQRKRE